jgi:hypothetical protein
LYYASANHKGGVGLSLARRDKQFWLKPNTGKRLNFLNNIKQNKMDGLIVKNGRLINLRPDSEMGITKMARMKKAEKRAEKISMIVEANRISNMLDNG